MLLKTFGENRVCIVRGTETKSYNSAEKDFVVYKFSEKLTLISSFTYCYHLQNVNIPLRAHLYFCIHMFSDESP